MDYKLVFLDVCGRANGVTLFQSIDDDDAVATAEALGDGRPMELSTEVGLVRRWPKAFE